MTKHYNNSKISRQFWTTLAEVPGVAREIKKIKYEFFFLKV